MNLSDFQQQINPTKSPVHGRAVYHALGLCGEIGEVCNKLKKVERGDFRINEAGLVCELGGVMWYACALANDLGIGLIDTSIDRVDSPRDLGLRLAVIAGFVAEGAVHDEMNILDLRFVLNDLVQLVRCLSLHCFTTLPHVLQANVDLIADRTSRGVLQGSGDDR